MIPPAKRRYLVNFPDHMANCECNYHRLRRLLPGWRVCRITPSAGSREDNSSCRVTTILKFDNNCGPEWHYAAGRAGHELAITMQLREAAKYTTTIRIVVDSATPYTNYCLDARLYHDATLAEVIAWQGRRGFQPKYSCPNPDMYQPNEKAQLNRFLGELLEFCLVEGRVQRAIATTDADSVAAQ